MAVCFNLIWLVCALTVITQVQGKTIPEEGLIGGFMANELSHAEDDSKSISSRVRTGTAGYPILNKAAMTYQVVDGPHAHREASLNKSRVDELVAKAFAEWAPHCGIDFHLWNSSGGGQPDITLSFERLDHGDGQPFDPSTLAHGSLPSVNQSYVHFNDDRTWVESDIYGVKLGEAPFYHIALHEIGHVLGLNHIHYINSIMYPSTSNSYINSLDALDIEVIRYLYNRNNGSSENIEPIRID